ncbi:endonuclease/exonuclease/phosphatase family protein (plasmid) [Pedobacter sp. BS3]|uniref:endonuclease/exonuclease/phosphatase family protein n=1 Tax=Pedobacter sp. BS3 TaxID=2567937 RepID=UPI0011EF4FD2|nr:endonuclease/exonuclease/phosphatase family protein [Pedobacter sp. BS3]TZF86298.1 endonuclease/exonuclease/phosphatase family protein [Pedobacter sp. BS3]
MITTNNSKSITKTIGYFVYVFMLLSVTACKKSIDPGNWDILTHDVVDPGPGNNDPDDKKTITLKVMSYNAKLANANDFTTLVDYIKEYQPDLLLLRQVDSATTRANKINRPQEVADATGMNVFFAKAFDYQTGGYGNAVLSKYPIVGKKSILLQGGTEVRSLAAITVKIDDLNTIVFAGTELDPFKTDESARISQILPVLTYTHDLTDPVILAGNFNFNLSGQGYNNITNTQVYNYIIDQFTFGCIGGGCALNSPVAAPTGIFDFVAYKPSDRFSVTNYSAGSKTTSGFLPIMADLKLTLNEE